MEVTDRVVLITGGKRIGATVATELARSGADVAMSFCQSQAEATSAVEAVRAHGRRGLAIPADLRDPQACVGLVDRVVDSFGRIDVLVAMASVYRKTPLSDLDARDWDEGLSVDLSAGFHCARAALSHMQAQSAGRIIFFADTEAASGRPRHTGYLAYYVAKSGVIALSRALALELASDGILVNTVALGPILPGDGATVEECEETARQTPVGRWGSVCEVARVVRSLIESDYITGEVIRVDGGRHLA